MTEPAETAFEQSAELLGVNSNTDRAAWLDARRAGLGASDTANAIGMGMTHSDGTQWTSPLEVWMSKVAPVDPDEDSAGEAALWGQLFEPVILRELGRRLEIPVSPGGELLRSRSHGHLLATLDGVGVLQGAPTPIEIKTTGMGQRYEEEVPLEVQVQAQQQMLVTGADRCLVAWLPFPARVLGHAVLVRHEEFQAKLVESTTAFWELVRARQPPEVDASASCAAALGRLYPGTDGTAKQLGEEAAFWVDELEEARRLVREAEKAAREMKNKLHSAIGHASIGVLPDSRSINAAWTKDSDVDCKHCGGALYTRKGHRHCLVRQAPQSVRDLQKFREKHGLA